MSSNNFEKQVQRNLEELQFAPSEAVWQNVEKELRKGKKRRRWFLLPLLLLFVGGAGYFVYNNATSNTNAVQSSKPAAGSITAVKEAKAENKNVLISEEKSDINADKENKTAHVIADNPTSLKNTVSTSDKPLSSSANNKTGEEAISVSSNKNSHTLTGIMVDKTKNNYSKAKKAGGEPISRMAQSDEIKPNINNNVNEIALANEAVNKPVAASKNKPDETNAKLNIVTQPQEKDEALTNTVKETVVSEAVVKNDTIQKKNKIDTLAIPVAVKSVNKESKKSKWKWSVDAVVGTSNLTTSFAPLGALGISSENKSADALVNFSANRTPGQNLQVVTKPGFSFKVGLAAERKISKRNSFSVGLQYAYYSNLGVAGAVADTAIINAGLQNLNIASSRGVYISGPVSNNGNQYHFLAIPVSFNTQIGNSKRLPWFWNTGLSLNYLFASNAVVYNSTAKVYNKNNNLFRPLQVGWHTGFEAEFFSKKKYPLRLGPQFNFNLSRMLRNPDGQNHRFTYAGMKASVLLNRK